MLRKVPAYSVRSVFRPFSDACNSSSEAFRDAEIEALAGEAASWLRQNFIIRQEGHFDSSICPACGEFHDIHHLALFDKNEIFCPQQTSHPIEVPEERRYLVDRRMLASQVCNLLRLDTGVAREVISDRLYLLGYTGTPNRYPVYFLVGAHGPQDLDNDIEALAKAPHKDRGVLITTERLSRALKLPGKLHPIELDDLLVWDGTTFAVQPELLERAIKGKWPKKPTGPTSLKQPARDFRDLMNGFGVTFSTKLEQAEAVLSLLRTRYPERTMPSLEHVRDDWLSD